MGKKHNFEYEHQKQNGKVKFDKIRNNDKQQQQQRQQNRTCTPQHIYIYV